MRLLLTTALIAPLAACGSSQPNVKATNASVAEVQARVADATRGKAFVKPGRWEGNMVLHDMRVRGLPPEVQKQMSARMREPHPFTSCATPEDAKANRGFFTGGDNHQCTYAHFTMHGGKIDAAMVCNDPAGTMKATIVGQYGPESYHLDMHSAVTAPGMADAGVQRMTISIDAKRTGACRGDESNAAGKGVTTPK